MPELAAITSDLREIVKHGVRNVPETAQVPALAELLCVQQQAQGSGGLDRIIAIEGVVQQAIETLEGTPPHEVLRLLFGLTASTTGTLAKQRRRDAARQASTTAATFNRHDEQRLLQVLARRIYELEADARLTQERLGPPPSTAEIRASWFERFTHYHRLQAILRELRLDLIAVLLTYSTHSDDETGRDDYLDSSIWRYTRFLTAHDDFLDRLGIWLMPEPAADAEATTAIELLLWHAPFNERGRSWLRTTISQVPSSELHPFAQRLRDGPDGTEVLGLWEQWLEVCHCDSEAPDLSCRPHQVIDQCERFDTLIEVQWALVRDAYRALLPPSPRR